MKSIYEQWSKSCEYRKVGEMKKCWKIRKVDEMRKYVRHGQYGRGGRYGRLMMKEVLDCVVRGISLLLNIFMELEMK